jgi:quercetin dioxygenase-like cupin family protein
MDTPTIRPPDPDRIVRAFGGEVHFLQSSEDTGNRFCQWLEITPPGGGPPPHSHAGEDEWFHVLEGEVEFFAEGTWSPVPVGGRVFCPRGSVHAFRNTGPQPLRLLITTAPGGFDRFFRRAAAEFAQPGGPDMARVLAIAAEHGIAFVGP